MAGRGGRVVVVFKILLQCFAPSCSRSGSRLFAASRRKHRVCTLRKRRPFLGLPPGARNSQLQAGRGTGSRSRTPAGRAGSIPNFSRLISPYSENVAVEVGRSVTIGTARRGTAMSRRAKPLWWGRRAAGEHTIAGGAQPGGRSQSMGANSKTPTIQRR
jgi:hypothetical protein